MRLRVWAAAAAVFMSTPPLSASPPACDTRHTMTQHLAERYGEIPTGYGASNAGALVELLVSNTEKATQTWSIIVTLPDGRTCLLAAGEGWRALDAPPSEPET